MTNASTGSGAEIPRFERGPHTTADLIHAARALPVARACRARLAGALLAVGALGPSFARPGWVTLQVVPGGVVAQVGWRHGVVTFAVHSDGQLWVAKDADSTDVHDTGGRFDEGVALLKELVSNRVLERAAGSA